MTFRRPKSDAHRRSREWHAWIDQNRQELSSIGLPAEAYLNEDRWLDFLENGHLHRHDSTGFAFTDLAEAQMAALRRFLEREYASAKRCPPLLNWLRVRCGWSRWPGPSQT